MIKKTSQIQAWMMAIRLRTILIPTIQIAVSISLASFYVEKINWWIALGAWLVAVLVTIGTNLINDVIDFEKGGDSPQRFGQIKVIRAGLLSKLIVKKAGFAALSIACLLPFLIPVNITVCALVILSACCGFCYTGGPYPISYLGLSEIFIFIFYGLICILTPFYVLTGLVNEAALLVASQMGLLAILPNALNNFRDIYEDRAIHKKTLAARFGVHFARFEIVLLSFLPFVLGIGWLLLGFIEASLMPLLLLPLPFIFTLKIWNNGPGPHCNKYFMMSVIFHFLFGITLIVGWNSRLLA